MAENKDDKDWWKKYDGSPGKEFWRMEDEASSRAIRMGLRKKKEPDNSSTRKVDPEEAIQKTHKDRK